MVKGGFILLLLFIVEIGNAQLSIMSYNIRYDNVQDNEDWWGHRKGEVADLIERYHPSIFGIQEGLSHQVHFLDTLLHAYDFIGVGRDDGIEKGEYTAIFYDKRKVSLLTSKTYWLSETPNEVSVGWDASMERIVTYGRFKELKTGRIIHVFNAHFDHIGELAREHSAKLIIELMDAKNLEQEQVLLIGDLNCEPDSKPMALLRLHMTDSFVHNLRPQVPIGTFNNFETEATMDRRIDYVLAKNLKIHDYINIIDRRKNGRWPSDHTPVLVTFE